MRVAVASWSARRVGGVEDYLSILLPALTRAGVEVAFWHEVDEPSDRAPIPLTSGSVSIDVSQVGVAQSIARLRAWKPDVIYSQGVQDPAAESQLLDVAPAICFVHTYVGTCISGTKMFSYPQPAPCTRVFGRSCLAHYFPRGCGGNSPATMLSLYHVQSRRLEQLRRYRSILTHTGHMRDEMMRHGLHATVLPFAVDMHPARASARVDDRWRLLFAGRMERLKGGEYLLDALPEVARRGRRSVHAVLAGDGTRRDEWQRKAREIERANTNVRVEFAGWLSQSAVSDLMNDADLLVVPSVWPEPFGSVGVAAAAQGVPAAAFDVGGISEWLKDGVSGHFAAGNPPTAVGLADAVVRCLDDPAHFDRLRAGARETAARFTIERHLAGVMTELARV